MVQLRQHTSALPTQATYLVPLRAFLGLGWLRAGAAKLIEPGWQDGTALRVFLDEQAAAGLVLPFYRPFLHLLELIAAPVGVTVLVTELVVGLAILLGIRTTSALLVAIVLNVNFILAGETNPGVFYIVVGLVLLTSGAGRLLGWDGMRPPPGRLGMNGLSIRSRFVRRRTIGFAAGGSLLLVPFITTTSPALVIHDPAAVLALLLLLTALGLAIHKAQTSAPADEHGGYGPPDVPAARLPAA